MDFDPPEYAENDVDIRYLYYKLIPLLQILARRGVLAENRLKTNELSFLNREARELLNLLRAPVPRQRDTERPQRF